jgi:hypothetical protein
MTRIIKSLLGKKPETPPEEIEALNRATEFLQFRVAQMTKAQNSAHAA